MNWKFWKKAKDTDETTIKVTTGAGTISTEIYVCAQTSDKALELYRELDGKEKK